jgi:isopenicillin N synthase-like dioxygenase
MAISNGDIVQIPVINISEPNESVGDALIDAASKHGFIYVESKGTGFTAEYVDRAFELSKLFFDSPREEKAGCMITEDVSITVVMSVPRVNCCRTRDGLQCIQRYSIPSIRGYGFNSISSCAWQ